VRVAGDFDNAEGGADSQETNNRNRRQESRLCRREKRKEARPLSKPWRPAYSRATTYRTRHSRSTSCVPTHATWSECPFLHAPLNLSSPFVSSKDCLFPRFCHPARTKPPLQRTASPPPPPCLTPHTLPRVMPPCRNGWTVGAAATSSQSSEQRSINILIACALLLLSGLFSGLTLGLMSLDMVSLEILSESGEEMERVYAKKIIPVRAKGNLLLCTLLLGNTMVNGATTPCSPKRARPLNPQPKTLVL